MNVLAVEFGEKLKASEALQGDEIETQVKVRTVELDRLSRRLSSVKASRF
jgi:hypothetical protein